MSDLKTLIDKVKAHVALGAGVSGVTRREALIALDEIAAAPAPSVLGEGDPEEMDCTCVAPHPACPNCNGTGRYQR